MLNKKLITDYDLENKKVIIRADFNVPVKDGYIQDDNRIREEIPTIKHAIKNGAKVILLSHLGRVKTEEDLKDNSLSIVAVRLGEILYKQVIFIDKTRGSEVEEAINNMKPGDIVMLENTRFEDLDGNKESGNDQELAKYWASLGDIFINDAFGTIHRSHASNVGIANYLPNGIGFLVQKELEAMMPILENPSKPFIVVLGGAKVKDKIGIINNLITKADYILIGGGMANTFLKAKGLNVGKSIVDDEHLKDVINLINNYGRKLILPVDVVTGETISEITTTNIKNVNEIGDEDYIVDIGPKTIELFKKGTTAGKTIIWNGPMGVFEIDRFALGTKEILSSLVGYKTVIIGGGDTASAAINMGFKDKFTHISTGGGASLEMFAGHKLPGLEIINEK